MLVALIGLHAAPWACWYLSKQYKLELQLERGNWVGRREMKTGMHVGCLQAGMYSNRPLQGFCISSEGRTEKRAYYSEYMNLALGNRSMPSATRQAHAWLL